MMDLHQLLPILHDLGEIDFSGRRLKIHERFPGAPLAPVYVKLRVKGHKDGNLTPELVRELALHMLVQIRQLTLDFMPSHICGVPQAGEPFAQVIAEQLLLPELRLVKVETEGDQRRVVASDDLAEAKPGNEVLLIDNAASSGASLHEAAQVLRAHKYKVVRFFVILDRQQGGFEYLLQHRLSGCALFTLREMLDILAEVESITPERRQFCLSYPERLRAYTKI